jgi:hypothetical protein
MKSVGAVMYNEEQREERKGNEWIFGFTNEKELVGAFGQHVDILVDSGAVDSCCPRDFATAVPTEKGEVKRFVSLQGAPIRHYGEKDVTVKIEETGEEAKIKMQVTNCKSAVMSVAKVCDKGNRVVFEQDGGWIEEKRTGRRIGLKRINNLYLLKAKIEENGLDEARVLAPVRQEVDFDRMMQPFDPDEEEIEEEREVEHPDEREDVEGPPQATGPAIPSRPTKEMKSLHRLTHSPFESWCEVCVAARAKDAPHRRLVADESARMNPVIQCDYQFFSQDGSLTNEGNARATVLVAVDCDSGFVYASVVRRKGPKDRFAVLTMVRFLRDWGMNS